MTSFFAVHLMLTVVSLTLGTIIGVYGIRALLRARRGDQRTSDMADGDRDFAARPR